MAGKGYSNYGKKPNPWAKEVKRQVKPLKKEFGRQTKFLITGKWK